jgi:protein-disulfide isomerase
MEEFGDFQCPFCQRYHEQTEPSLVEQYVDTSKVYFTYRSAGNWVSQNIGGGKTESQDAAAAAYCAEDQNKFWEMHDVLFANILGEDAGSFTDERLATLAGKAGLDLNTFNDCFSSGKYKDRVQQDYANAIASGVQGTPSFLVTYTVNGQTKTKLIEGAQPFTAFQQELDTILQEIEK